MTAMKADPKKMLNFINLLEGLKKIERFKGQAFWRDYPTQNRYESVADHSWRLAMMVIAIEPYLSQKIDMGKALKMALIHDIAEIITGDASPLGKDGTGQDSHAYNKAIAKKRQALEKKASKKIFGELPTQQATELFALWLEYEDQASFEARIVKAMDRIEGKIQAFQYMKGRFVKKHLEFNLTYGKETFSADEAVEDFGEVVLEEFRRHFKEFTIKADT